MLIQGLVKLSDGFIFRTMLGKGEWHHWRDWAMVPVFWGIGLALTGLIWVCCKQPIGNVAPSKQRTVSILYLMSRALFLIQCIQT